MDNSNPPKFQSPIPTVSPSVRSLTENNELFLEKGVSFSKFISLKPLDPLDLIKNSGVLCYYFRDNSVFVNTKRIFLEIEFEACLDTQAALTQSHNVSACNVMSHSIIDSCVLNIGNNQKIKPNCSFTIQHEKNLICYLRYPSGECQLNRNQGFYPLIAKANYITRYSDKARTSFLADFEGKIKMNLEI